MEETVNIEGNENGSVVHESIADAARTRHMWQQMAAQSQQNGNQKSLGRFSASHKSEHGSQQVISGNGHLQQQPKPTGNGYGDKNWQRSDTRQQPTIGDPKSIGSTVVDSDLENEKRIFMAYVLSHSEVVTSLGITVPWQVRQKYQQYAPSANVKVELAVVGGAVMDENQSNGRVSATLSTRNENGNGYINGSKPAVPQPQPQSQQYHTTGRYVKNWNSTGNGNGHIQSGNGWQKRIGRRQSQSMVDGPNTPPPSTPPAISATSTMPRQSKSIQWTNTLPVARKGGSAHDGDTEGFVDEAGNVYKSMGESIIAKEIREYREREEELRRSRSQLGLPTLEDMLDNWKGHNANGRTQSVDHLHVSMESERVLDPAMSRDRAGSVEALAFTTMQNSTTIRRPISVDPTVGQVPFTPIDAPSPKNSYERLLLSRADRDTNGGGVNIHKTSAPAGQNGAFRKYENWRRKSDAGFVPVEARIEQEMEELKRREEELRLEREAAVLRYSTMANEPSPLASSSPTHSANGNLSTHMIGDKRSHEYVSEAGDGNKKWSSPGSISSSSIVSPTNSSCVCDDTALKHAASRSDQQSSPDIIKQETDPEEDTIGHGHTQQAEEDSDHDHPTKVTHVHEQVEPNGSLAHSEDEHGHRKVNVEQEKVEQDDNEDEKDTHGKSNGQSHEGHHAGKRNFNVDDILLSL